MLCKEHSYQLASKIILAAFGVNFVCVALKIYLYTITMSLAVFAYTLDTLMDIINDVVALYGARMASKPPDEEHPYGHGKYDALISIFIATTVIVSAIEIFREVLTRALYGGEKILFGGLALIIFLLLIIIYISLASIEYYFSKKLNISIMESSALHYITDPFYTIMVLLSVYVSAEGLPIIDLLAATLIGLMIIIGGTRIIKKQIGILLDEAVIPAYKLREEILSNFPEVVNVCNIRSRSDGIRIYLEFRLVLGGNLNLKEAYEIAHKIEKFIKDKYGDNIITTIILAPHDKSSQETSVLT